MRGSRCSPLFDLFLCCFVVVDDSSFSGAAEIVLVLKDVFHLLFLSSKRIQRKGRLLYSGRLLCGISLRVSRIAAICAVVLL